MSNPVQLYQEKPVPPPAPLSVYAFQVPDGETVTVVEADGSSRVAAAGDFVEVAEGGTPDDATTHVKAWAAADFNAKFELAPPPATTGTTTG